MTYLAAINWTSADIDRIAARRKAYVAMREEMAGFQREFARTDRAAARYFSDDVAGWQQREKAATWAIAFIRGNAPAYQEGRFVGFPAELAGMCKGELGV